MNGGLFLGDCLEILKTIPDNSVDSLVTDPPAGISFMGKEWDSAKGGRREWVEWMASVMRECLRVMKPGAHGLVWAIPRTSHWTATALEDAGFEVRDVITHLFGQGFPKSLDISKAIDKAAGAEGPIVGKNPSFRERQLEHDAQWPTSMRPEFKRGPATDAAKQWSGWGTALKPASQHWILVRKPCAEKTVAANVLEWGTGAINIDGCRIGFSETENVDFNRIQDGNIYGSSGIYGKAEQKEITLLYKQSGRFPANLVLSHSPYCTDDQCDIECAIERLDGQSAQEASRFFYCAKISPSERGEGNNHPTVKPQKLMQYFCRLVTPPSGLILDPFMGSGSTGLAAKTLGFEFLGIEKDPGYFEISARRMNGK